jgi:hypothetical protein
MPGLVVTQAGMRRRMNASVTGLLLARCSIEHPDRRQPAAPVTA